MGDFCRGVDLQSLPHSIKLGIENHRFVDHFTDQHEGGKAFEGAYVSSAQALCGNHD